MNDFLIRITLLFIPGIIAFIIIEKFTNHRELKNRDIMLYIFILGFSSYFVLYLCVGVESLFYNSENSVIFFKSLLDPKIKLDFKEILWATFLSIFLGIGITYLINYDIIFRFARKIKMTTEFAYPSVLDYLLNVERNRAVVIREKDKNIVYYGWVGSCETKGDFIELYLKNIVVYDTIDKDDVRTYRIPEKYFLRKKDNLDIELVSEGPEDLKESDANE